MSAGRNIISLYSKKSLNNLNKEDFIRIKELCEESIEVLCKVDPGYPLWKAETLKDLSTAMMNLARWNVRKMSDDCFYDFVSGQNSRWGRSVDRSS